MFSKNKWKLRQKSVLYFIVVLTNKPIINDLCNLPYKLLKKNCSRQFQLSYFYCPKIYNN